MIELEKYRAGHFEKDPDMNTFYLITLIRNVVENSIINKFLEKASIRLG